MSTKLNKGELSRQREQLRLLERLLPSLDLKRRQLTLQRELERERLRSFEAAQAQLHARIGVELPMLADAQVELGALVRVVETEIGEENVVAVRLPVLGEVRSGTAV